MLLMPFALSCRIFISLCFVLEVFCLFRVCGSVQVWVCGELGGGSTYGSLCDVINMWRESGCVGCIRSRV